MRMTATLQTRPMADSWHQLPSLVQGRAQHTASSGQSESRRRISNKGNSARGRHNCIRATTFRQSNQNLYVTDFIGEQGNCSYEVQEGRLNIISHQSVLQALEYCTSQHRCKRRLNSMDNHLISWALDETQTVADLSLILNGTEGNEQAALVEL
jgi:hypothetical protein